MSAHVQVAGHGYGGGAAVVEIDTVSTTTLMHERHSAGARDVCDLGVEIT